MNALVPTTLPKPPKADAYVDKRINELGEFLRGYSPNVPEPKYDVLMNDYRIDLKTPLPEMNKHGARAYAATDLGENRAVYALVFDSNAMPRHSVITRMKNIRTNNLVSVVASGLVELSEPREEHLVVILDRPKGKKLTELLANNKAALPFGYMVDKIIAPIVQGLLTLAEAGITHGNINPDNIFFDNQAVLGECISEPCGYSQVFYYELVERMQCLPAGKGEHHPGADYYALAVLLMRILFGDEHFNRYNLETLPRQLLRAGPFMTLTKDQEIPEGYYDFLWGMLGSGANERWTYRYLKPWLDGKHYNIVPSPAPTEGNRPYEYFDSVTMSRREICEVFYKEWNKVGEALAEHPLNHWILVALKNKELSEVVGRIARVIIESRNKIDQRNEMIYRLLITLDLQGPLRYDNVAFRYDGIESLYASLYFAQAKEPLAQLTKFIELNLISAWVDLKKISESTLIEDLAPLQTRIERLRSVLRGQGLGFGAERILYELNPDMPCLSPLCRGRHINSLPALLKHLDKIAPNFVNAQDPIDVHIAAYIAAKLAIQNDIKLYDLAAMPTLANHPSMVALKLLAIAQHRAGKFALPGLTHWIASRIMPVIVTFRSMGLRKRAVEMLCDEAIDGFNQRIGELLLDGEFVNAEIGGYKKAVVAYQINTKKIEEYKSGKFLDRDSAQLAYFIAKLFAYMAFLLSVFNLVRGH